MKNPLYIEASGVRLRRSICGRCGFPCIWLGEAIRIDLAEGGFTILHVCLPCVRRSCLSVAAGRQVRHGREVQAA